MSLKEYVAHQIEFLEEEKLKKVADYLTFLKLQDRISRIPKTEEATWAMLYAEAAEEDRELAEEGLEDYVRALAVEDMK